MTITEGTNCGFLDTVPTGDPGGTSGFGDRIISACKFTTSQAGKINEIGAYLGYHTENDFEFAIYSHDSGNNRPSSKLGSGTGRYDDDVGWYSVVVDVTLTNATTYWLAAQADGFMSVIDYSSNASYKRDIKTEQSSAPASWGSSDSTDTSICAIYAIWAPAATGTNTQINIGDDWKEIEGVQINIGDTWKAVAGMQINIGDTWKEIF